MTGRCGYGMQHWGVHRQAMRGHEDGVWSVAFSPDGTRIVSGSSDKTLRLWDSTTGQSIGAPLRGHEDWVLSVAFSPGGKRHIHYAEQCPGLPISPDKAAAAQE